MAKRILLLVAAHLVALGVSTFAAFGRSWPNFAGTVQVSLIFAEAGLLGFWGALAMVSRWTRLLAATFGLICLITAAVAASDGPVEVDELCLMGAVIAAPALIIYVVLNRLRRGPRGVQLTRLYARLGIAEGFQFTIRHLLIATALVAVILTCGKTVQAWRLESKTLFHASLIIAVVTPCLVIVELATFWGALGIGRPFPRLVVVLPVAFVLGLIPTFYLMHEMGWQQYFTWSCITGGQSAFTAGTLLVLRRIGWRLCRLTNDVKASCAERQVGDEGLEPPTSTV